MVKAPLSVTIIAYNEADRIEDCLKSVSFAEEIIVILDSKTSDETGKIAQSYGAKVIETKFSNYGNQKNIAVSKASFEWILSIDADERISTDLKNEILRLIKEGKEIAAYVNRKSNYLNKWILHGGWYPDIILRLFKKSSGKFTEPEIHEELVVPGNHPILKGDLIHYPFRSFSHQILKNMRYAKDGSRQLLKKNKKFSIVKLLIKPSSKFFECYFYKLGFLDGLPGLVIAINAAYSVFMKWGFLKYENSDS